MPAARRSHPPPPPTVSEMTRLIADLSICVDNPLDAQVPPSKNEVNPGSTQCADGRDMNDTAREFKRLLGHAALKLWPDMPEMRRNYFRGGGTHRSRNSKWFSD